MSITARVSNLIFNAKTWIYIYLTFPLLDYLLRNYSPIPIIAPLWHNGVLLLLLIFLLIQLFSTNRQFPSIKIPLLAFTLLGVAHIVIDLPNWQAGMEGFRAVFQYVLAVFVGFYLVANFRDAISFLRTIAVIGCFAALVGVAQVALGVETPASWTDASEQGLVRAFSFVVSPNVLGSYMALLFPLLIGLGIYEKHKWLRLAWLGGAFMSAGSLVLSGSRGAWLALFAAVFIIFLLFNRKLMIISIVGAVAAGAGVGPIRSRILSLFSATYLEKSSTDGRIARWTNAFHEMRFDPFFGKGIGHYGGAVGSRYFGTTYVDSYYFKTLAEMGLIGFALFLWLMVDTMRHLMKCWQVWKGTKVFYLLGGIVIGLFAVLLHNGVENIFEVPFMNVYFWFLAGLVLAFPYFREGDSHEQTEDTVE